MLRNYRSEFERGDFHDEIVKYLEDQCFSSINFKVNYYETCENISRTKIRMELTFRVRWYGSDLFYFDICPDYLAEDDDDEITANITYRKNWRNEIGGVTLTYTKHFRIDYRKENYISSFIKLLHNCIYDFSNC